MYTPSTRAQVITRRTYSRPLDGEGTKFETWEQTIDRVIGHQKWLWERAKGNKLSPTQGSELTELRALLLDRKVSMSGRTLWLGGTEVSKKREASQFNCSFTEVETVEDVVDIFWLLLQGCGVGFKPIVGTLNGFKNPVKDVEIIKSTRKGRGGKETNTESFKDGVWTIKVGDSAEAWAKVPGKLLAGKYPASKLVLDFTEIRPSGERLAGYGWISSGYEPFAKALSRIVDVLSRRADQLLTRVDILDVVNLLGTTLSSRRSAEIALFEYGKDEWREFAGAKKDFWEPTGGTSRVDGTPNTNMHRCQSNNSLVFSDKPSREDLDEIFTMMIEAGGSEPGFINGQTALERAPWWSGVNPCAEILLGNKSFCNLTEIDLGKFKDDSASLHRATYLLARANYRQTLVDFRDGILQKSWHDNNQYLRLCGVGITGVCKRPDLQAYDYKVLKNEAVRGAYSMAEELGTQRPKNITTVKPSGTLSKIMDTTEGVHKPLGKYVFNNVNFSSFDPLIEKLREANYKCMVNPTDSTGVIVTFPVEYKGVDFTVVGGKEVNIDGAITQLNRYKMIQQYFCEQNTSVTVSYVPEEKDAIVQWVLDNWDVYVGVSFLFRTDPSKTAKDLGYLYLPQEVVTKETYDNYVATLKEVQLDSAVGIYEIDNDECEGGVCPVK